jgi:photosystem II stability/assembly factor-like uncharacterized protein
MSIILYIVSSIGMFIVAHSDGNWHILKHILQNHSLTSIAAKNGVILVGTSDGLWRSGDQGESWQMVQTEFAPGYVRWLIASKNQTSIFFAGTEPAGIYNSRDGGLTWNRSVDVEKLRDAKGWYLPYSSNAGCVRGFAIFEKNRTIERIYAAAEVGGALLSLDEGQRWQLVEGSDGNPDFSREIEGLIHPDMHSISVHPSSAEIVTAPTGGGLYRSYDGGRTWKNIYLCYIRAAWVDPVDPQHIIAGPADGVSRNGRIEESNNGGKTWHSLSTGMEAPWESHMVERFFHTDNYLYAILSNGELWTISLGQKKWKHILKEIGEVKAIASSK